MDDRTQERVASLATVYGTALLAGLSVVSFPASAGVLKERLQLSDAQYGTLFLPQLALTLLGSLFGARWRSQSLHVLRGALVAFLLAEIALWSSARLAVYGLVLFGTGAVGLGFGLAAGPLNSLPGLLAPKHQESALVALHTVMGAGFTLGPLAVGVLSSGGHWALAPWLVAGALVLAVLLSLFARVSPGAQSARARAARPWRFVAIALLYALAEGTFSNWTTVYLLEERRLDVGTATLALSAFWAALVLGRLLMSWLLLYVAPTWIWRALPCAMALAFCSLPAVRSATGALFAFGLAGLACSAFFPLTVARAAAASSADAVAGPLTAALMLGAGVASFAVGPLRSILSLAQIYALSAAWPLAAAALVFTARRAQPSAASSRSPARGSAAGLG
ncbi:MAG TPA: MFS transporter [Polyangiales bacterium]